MRKSIPFLVFAALLATACKSTGDSSASTAPPTSAATTTSASPTSPPSSGTGPTDDTQPSTSEAAPASTDATPASTDETTTTEAATTTTAGPPGPGVSADSIKLGIVYPDLDAVRQFVDLDHGSYEDAYNAVIADINAKGGINGRQIVPVFVSVSPLGTDPAAAACTKLTEDEQVFAVVGNQLDGDAPLCYVETHDTPLIGGIQTAERLGRAKAPWYSYLLSADHATVKLIDAWNDEGDFDGKKVALVSLAADEATMKNVAIPELQRLGIEPVDSAVIDAPPTDVQAAYDQVGVISQKFSADGADVVILVGQVPTTWGQGSATTTYRPRLLGTSLSAMQAYGADKVAPDPEIIADALTGDGGSLDAAWTDDVTSSCVGIVEAAGPQEPINDPRTATADTKGTWVAPVTACATITLFAVIATKAGDTLNAETFRAAGDSLGQIDLPSIGGPSNYSATSTDGDAPVFMQRWDAALGKFVVDTEPVS